MSHSTTNRSAFRSISHPLRRRLLDRLRQKGEQPVHALSKPFQVSQPALSQHLRVLRESGLVESRRAGKERLYRLRPEPLAEVAGWLEPYARFWRDRLGELGEHMDDDREEGGDG